MCTLRATGKWACREESPRPWSLLTQEESKSSKFDWLKRCSPDWSEQSYSGCLEMYSSTIWGKLQYYWLKQDSRNSFMRAGLYPSQPPRNNQAGSLVQRQVVTCTGRWFSAGFSLQCSLCEKSLCRNGCQALLLNNFSPVSYQKPFLVGVFFLMIHVTLLSFIL